MDQVKIGKFIQEVRKEQNLTQKEVAEKLNISDKTVSKWETGNGLPEVGLMLPLCKLLGLSVNELLSGERLDEKQYHERAEKNIMSLMNERKYAKKKTAILMIIAFSVIITCCALFIVVGLAEMEAWLRILLIVIGFIAMSAVILCICFLDNEIGDFECVKCGEHFTPSYGAYIMGMHTITRRHLRCPKCGKKSWCKKTLLSK